MHKHLALATMLFAVLALPVLAQTSSQPGQTIQRKPGDQIWMAPTPEHNNTHLRQLFEKPSQWSQTRQLIDVLYCYGSIDVFTDHDLRIMFSMMRQWKLKFAMESPAVKPWGKTAAEVYRCPACSSLWDRCIALGAPFYAIALDEPYFCVSHDLKLPESYAVEQTAQFIARVRRDYPDMIIGDTEPYPYFTTEEMESFIKALQARLKQMNVRGMDFFKIDTDWSRFPHEKRGSWPQVKALEDFCRSQGIKFSMIYWAADFWEYKRDGKVTDSIWYDSIMKQGQDYAAVGGAPDQFIIQSWLDAPPKCIPEDAAYTFTRSVRDFVGEFVLHTATPRLASSAGTVSPARTLLGPTTNLDRWRLLHSGTAGAEMKTEDSALKLTVQNIDDANWHVSLHQDDLALQDGRRYTLSFQARASEEWPIVVGFAINRGDHHRLGLQRQENVPTGWQTYRYTFTAERTESGANGFFVDFGTRIGTLWLKDAALTEAP